MDKDDNDNNDNNNNNNNNNNNDDSLVVGVRVPRRSVRAFRSCNTDACNSSGSRSSTPSCCNWFPIIGLGCSSFSHFFWSDEELQNVGGIECWKPETIDRQHPQVQEWIETIHYAIQECGITLLDTAPWYGHGTSEVVVGWALEELLSLSLSQEPNDDIDRMNNNNNNNNKHNNTMMVLQRSDLIINTKVGRYEADIQHQFDFSYTKTVASVIQSLERLKCTYIDVLQLHDPEFAPTLQILLEETIPAMLYCQHEKKWCKALGITGYPLEVQHQILVQTMTKEYHETYCRQYFNPDNQNDTTWSTNRTTPFVFDQALTYCHSNLHDDSLFTRCNIEVQDNDENANDDNHQHDTFNNDNDSTTITTATPSKNKKMISYSTFLSHHDIILMTAAPLSMGLLTPTDHPPPDWHPASSELKEACLEAAKICEENDNTNLSTLALTVALANPTPSCTLLGMKNIAQVQTATQMAARFHNQFHTTDHDDQTIQIDTILKQVLNETEYKVWNILRDPKDGPFSKVWKNGHFRWDGALEGYLFWNQLNNKEIDDAKAHVQAVHWQAPPR